jgi:hypothetical protein
LSFGDCQSDDPPKQKTVTRAEAARIAFDLYNELAGRNGLPKAVKLDKTRSSNLIGRIKDAGGIDAYRKALEKAEASDFLMGRKTDFRMSLRFLCQQSSFIDLIEGKYDNIKPANGHDRSAKPAQNAYGYNGHYVGKLI